MLTIELQSRKAFRPMAVTEDGNRRCVRELHHWNAEFPIVVTEAGISTTCNDLHP